jgi:hypothetical protein
MRLFGFILVVLIFLVALAWQPIAYFVFKDTVHFTVEHRERVADSSGSSRYMIWGTVDGQTEVFENVDSWLALKFNSADQYGLMREGFTCDATVTGLRIPFLSMNRNILDVSCEQQQ